MVPDAQMGRVESPEGTDPMTANPLLALAEKMIGRAECLEFVGCDYANVTAQELREHAAELTALAAAHEGMVLVPKEPTAEIFLSIAKAFDIEPLSDGSDGGYPITGRQSTVRQWYATMIAAATAPAKGVNHG